MKQPFTPFFRAAMQRHVRVAERHGEDSPEARRSFAEAMALAPKWFVDEMSAKAEEMGLLPKPSGYLDDGSPMFSVAEVAKQLGVSLEEADAAMREMLADRQALGLPNDGLVHAAQVHRRQ